MRTVRVTDLVYNGFREIASKIGAELKLRRVTLLLGLALFLLPIGMAGAQPQSYILVTLGDVKILDDKDPAMEGEILIMVAAATEGPAGRIVQTRTFPIRDWYEANDGNTIHVSGPIFYLPVDRMGESLVLTITAIDDDSYPGWAAWIIAQAIARTSAALGALVGELVGVPPHLAANIAGEAGERLGQEFTGWLGNAQRIGTYARVFYRSENWGSPRNYTARAGDMIVKYAVRLSVAPAERRSLRVHLKRIKVHENRDTWPFDGEIYIWYRVFDGIREMSGKLGPKAMEDGQTWNINRTIFRTTNAGSILHVEIDVWDEDEPSVGDDHDLLGTTAITWHRGRGPFRRTIKQRRAYVTIEYEIVQ